MPFNGIYAQWPEGRDFESTTPVLWPPIDRKLAMLGLTVSSEAERKQKVPAPGANERWTVRCPPLDLTWTWDGGRWLTWDDKPVTYPAYWYDGADDTPLSVGGGGTLTATYQRRGYWCDMTMVTMLGNDANDSGHVGAGGGEKWYWYLRYPPLDMLQVGTARVRLASTAEWIGAIGTSNFNRVYVAIGGNRLNKDVVPWDRSAGNCVLMQMTYRLRV